MADATDLAGRRVLVVEDEAMIALLLEDMLQDLGCKVIGTAATTAEGLDMASRDRIDVAVLDVNLGGHPVHALADDLRARGVPFVFSSGYGQEGLREADRGTPVLAKPFGQEALAAGLRQALDRG